MPEPTVDLADRPPLPTVMASYEALLDDVQAQVSAVAGDRQWRTGDNANASICQDAGRRGVTASRIGVALPDATWPAALTALTGVLAEHGFGAPEVLTDTPTLHSIQSVDQYGATFLFNTSNVIGTGVVTGCHRPG